MNLDWLEKDAGDEKKRRYSAPPEELEPLEASDDAQEDEIALDVVTLTVGEGEEIDLAVLASWKSDDESLTYLAVTDQADEDEVEVFFLKTAGGTEECEIVNDPDETAWCCETLTQNLGEDIVDMSDSVYDPDFAAEGEAFDEEAYQARLAAGDFAKAAEDEIDDDDPAVLALLKAYEAYEKSEETGEST